MIRLDTYPTEGMAALARSSTVSSPPPQLSCLLHSGVLPARQSLAVWVDGVSQTLAREENQEVFSWQCGIDTPMEIHLLMQHGQVVKAWRGWWKGGTTLAHTGTLALQVLCAGDPQPAGAAPSLPPPLSVRQEAAPVSHNGSTAPLSPTAAAVLEWPPLAEGFPAGEPIPRQMPREGDLWSVAEAEPIEEAGEQAEGSPLVPPPQRSEPTPRQILREDDLWNVAEAEPAEGAGEQAGIRTDAEESELEEGGEEGAWDEDEVETETEAWEEDEEETEAEAWEEDEAAGDEHAHSPLQPAVSASEPTSVVLAPAGTTVAAVHAASAWSVPLHEQALQHLATVLGALPARTIIVDLRRHAPTPRSTRRARSRPTRSGAQELGLTKEVLRTLYGACYWDRGALLPTSRRVERMQNGHQRWYMVVDKPEAAEGLAELVTALARGLSLLLVDRTVNYLESPRAAVIAELRQRVANLTVEICS